MRFPTVSTYNFRKGLKHVEHYEDLSADESSEEESAFDDDTT